jgi:hypothetical protein
MNARTLWALMVPLLTLCASEVQAHGGLVDLAVYDRTEGRPLPVYWHQGRAYVVGKPGNEYQVSVRNRLREDVLAVVSVDGVNVISGDSADPRQSGYVLGAQQAYDILGWRKSFAETAAFYFTALPDSYAARTGRPDNVGVIGVAVFRRKREPQAIAPPPRPFASAPQSGMAEKRAAEADTLSRDMASGPRIAQEEPRLGTGHGRREASYVQQVTFERATSAPAETIALYYDSYRNLLARGILREPRPPLAPLPRPFPGFVPDPQG